RGEPRQPFAGGGALRLAAQDLAEDPLRLVAIPLPQVDLPQRGGGDRLGGGFRLRLRGKGSGLERGRREGRRLVQLGRERRGLRERRRLGSFRRQRPRRLGGGRRFRGRGLRRRRGHLREARRRGRGLRLGGGDQVG